MWSLLFSNNCLISILYLIILFISISSIVSLDAHAWPEVNFFLVIIQQLILYLICKNINLYLDSVVYLLY